MPYTDHDKLAELIHERLKAAPAGLSEYALLKILHGSGQNDQLANAFANIHAMFRAHFLLFHVLYRLRDRLWADKQAHLYISPLKIQLFPYAEAQPGLSPHDPMREYYLDFSRLETTTAKDIEAMLAAFYIQLQNHSKRCRALAELGLEDPVDDATIKRQFRRLAMRHHPDRGGIKEKLQAINAAMAVLLSR